MGSLELRDGPQEAEISLANLLVTLIAAAALVVLVLPAVEVARLIRRPRLRLDHRDQEPGRVRQAGRRPAPTPFA